MDTEFKEPFLIILTGPPGSGKSTVTKILKEVIPSFEVASTDNIIEHLCDQEGITYAEGFTKFIGKATSEYNKKLSEYISNKTNVVVDRTNMNEKGRQKLLNSFSGYNRYAIAFELDDNELNRRNEKRANETGKTIPPHVMESMKESYQRPSVEEGFIEVVIIDK